MTTIRWYIVCLACGAALRLVDVIPVPIFAFPAARLLVIVTFAHLVARRLSESPPPSTFTQGLAGAAIIALPFAPAIISPERVSDAFFLSKAALVCIGTLLFVLYPHVPVSALIVGWRQAFRNQPTGVNVYRLQVVLLALLAPAGLWLGSDIAGATLSVLALGALVLLTLQFAGYLDISREPRSDGALWPFVLSVALAVLVLPVFRVAPLVWVWLPAGLLACGAVIVLRSPAVCAPLAIFIASIADTASIIRSDSMLAAVPMMLTLAAKATWPVVPMAMLALFGLRILRRPSRQWR